MKTNPLKTIGSLFCIPTPIGNLKDITYRSIETLQSVDVVFCENIHSAQKLLRHYNIEKKLYAHHQHNEHQSCDGIIKLAKEGKNIAYITEAGTPGISDPGYLLSKKCLEADIHVECLAGATAFVPALVVSGMPMHEFLFVGFLPHKKGRKTKLTTLASEPRTIILYESPHRLLNLLNELEEHFGKERNICVSKEISKLYEQHFRGTVEEVKSQFAEMDVKGEYVLCVEGYKD